MTSLSGSGPHEAVFSRGRFLSTPIVVSHQPPSHTVYCLTVYRLTVYCLTVYCLTVYCLTVCCLAVYRLTVYCLTVYCLTVCCLAVYCLTVCCLAVYCLTVCCLAVYCLTVYCLTVYCLTMYCLTVYCLAVYCLTVYCLTVCTSIPYVTHVPPCTQPFTSFSSCYQDCGTRYFDSPVASVRRFPRCVNIGLKSDDVLDIWGEAATVNSPCGRCGLVSLSSSV
ncbi:keratin-associated protein 10-12-like [Procambarus clarkii]|uniref:keratin-associated protein 10-12-like n=1 Tax=Procambarus clarkii TaxID=6728 RepID=UPI0037427CFC